jgi:hypothetical protein
VLAEPAVVGAILGIKASDWHAVVVAALTALATTLATNWIKERQRLETEKALHRAKADTDYEYEQRKKLRDAIGEYRGQLVEAATDFNYRLMNLDRNVSKGWLEVDGEYDMPKGRLYYFRSKVYRFLVLASVGNRFERRALHIDSRIAEPSDLTFLLYVEALRWAITDAALFQGVKSYSEETPRDHFYSDRLREMCASMYDGERDLRFGEFEDAMPMESTMDALAFFDGLRPGSFRWERLRAFRLLLLGFINAFGYEHQKSPQTHFDAVARDISTAKVADNLRPWLPKLGLGDDPQAQQIQAALAYVVAPHAE